MAEAAKKLTDVSRKKDSSEEGASQSVAKKKDWIGVVSMFFVIINLAAIGGLGFVLKKLWARIHLVEAKVEEVALIQKEETLPVDTSKKAGRTLTPQTPGTLYPLDAFLVNISSDQGPKFLQTQMELELSESSTEDELTKKKAAIRDSILVLLSSRNYKEIRDVSGMSNLRKDILKAVNNLLTTGKVRDVYFTQFHFN